MIYRLFTSTDAEDLQRQIDDLLKSDWRPQGGVAIVPGIPPEAKVDADGNYWGKPCYYYVQAMILPFGFNKKEDLEPSLPS